MNERTDREHREERVVELAWATLGERRPEPAGTLADDEDRTLHRLYLEVLGLIPYALDPIAPSADTERRILERVREPAPTGEAPPNATPARSPGVPRRHASRWLLPLAALLVLTLGTSGGLFYRGEQQKATIVRLGHELEDARRRAAAAASERGELAAKRDQLALVTATTTEVCPLTPAGQEVPGAGARGVLYVAADHQHWYLALEGLPPSPQGSFYHLWFMVDDRPVSGGAFDVAPGEKTELGSDRMPHGTGAVLVTLERERDVTAPSGPRVLYGDDVRPIL